MGIPARAAQWHAALSPDMRANIDSCAAGINLYASEHPEHIADSLRIVLPIEPRDVIAHGQKIINFEAHVVTPDRDFTGVTLVGMPTPVLGFNDHVGWSHTVNTQNAADVFKLTPAGGGYLLDGAERAYETHTELLTVKLANGSRVDTLVVRESVHGPVFRDDSTGTFAVRVAALDDPGANEQWWRMGKSKSMAEFEGAVREMHIPFFNVMAASGDGHTCYFFGGRHPGAREVSSTVGALRRAVTARRSCGTSTSGTTSSPA